MIGKSTTEVLETSNIIESVKPKRGRKPKQVVTSSNIISDNAKEEANNILISIEETKETDNQA